MNKSGFSLISAMVYAAIFTSVAVSIATIISQSLLGVNSVEARINQGLLAQAIQERVNDRAVCTAALGTNLFNVGAISVLNLSDATTDFSSFTSNTGARVGSISLAGVGLENFQEGANLAKYRLNVLRLRFANIRYVGQNIAAAGQQLYLVDIWGQFQATKQVLGPAVLKPIKLATAVVSEAGGRVQSCENIQDYPMVRCLIAGRIYFPYRWNSALGVAYDPDVNGCVSHDAWHGRRGRQGRQGDQGPVGNTGPTGPIGPAGLQPPATPPPIYEQPTPEPMPTALPPTPFPTPRRPKYSDTRVKRELSGFEYGLEEVLKIRPIWFAYNGNAGTKNGEVHAGVMAQELEKVAPKLVVKGPMKLHPNDKTTTEVRAVRYDEMNMMLIKALQEQQKELRKLEEAVSKLESSGRVDDETMP